MFLVRRLNLAFNFAKKWSSMLAFFANYADVFNVSYILQNTYNDYVSTISQSA